MAEVSNPGAGPKTISVYQVGKRDSYVIVAQLSLAFTARLDHRQQELEEAARQPIETRRVLYDPAALRSLLEERVEARLALEAQAYPALRACGD